MGSTATAHSSSRLRTDPRTAAVRFEAPVLHWEEHFEEALILRPEPQGLMGASYWYVKAKAAVDRDWNRAQLDF